jgi:hypothetical protein
MLPDVYRIPAESIMLCQTYVGIIYCGVTILLCLIPLDTRVIIATDGTDAFVCI